MQKNKESQSDKSINSNDENEDSQKKVEVEEEDEDEGYFLKLTKNKTKKVNNEENSHNNNNFLGRKTNANNPYYEKELGLNQAATNSFIGDKDKSNHENKLKSKGINGSNNNKWNKNGAQNSFTKQIPTNKKPKLICQFYVNGACNKGLQCTFSHDTEQIKKEVIKLNSLFYIYIYTLII